MLTTFNCQALSEAVSSLSLVEHCTVTKSGALRIATPFLYSDGSRIDLFLIQTDSLLEPYQLTDLGFTAIVLKNSGVYLSRSRKRQEELRRICEHYSTVIESDAFIYRFLYDQSEDVLSNAILNLSQACLRASDFVYLAKPRHTPTFDLKIRDYLYSHQFTFDEYPDDLFDRNQNIVRIPFRVVSNGHKSLIQTLSSESKDYLHTQALGVFAKWFDLGSQHSTHNFLTVYDAYSPPTPADLNRIRHLSRAYAFPDDSKQFAHALHPE